MKNCTTSPQKLLHDSHVQPSTLDVRVQSGAAWDRVADLNVYDTRKTAKFDTTVYLGSFQTIPAGEEWVIETAPLQADDKAFDVLWGPNRLSNIPRGSIRVEVVFESKLRTGKSEVTKKDEAVAVWTGTLRSNQVTFTLP